MMQGISKRTANRRLLVRAGLIFTAVLVAALSLYIGKGHTVVLDNMRPKTEDGPPAAKLVSVRLDGGEPVELTSGVRDLAKLMGQSHEYEIDLLDGSAPLKGRFRIAFGQEYIILSIPRLKAGLEPWIEPFFPFEQTAVTDDPDAGRTIQRSADAAPAP